jgi:hypothetical protein
MEVKVEETFVAIQGYPDYAISDHGRVMSLRRNRELTGTPNQWGVFSVGLTEDGLVTRIPIKNLVARHFVDGESEIFNSPVLKDTDQRNLHWTNIVWRPRWFAWEYTHQWRVPETLLYHGSLVDLDGGGAYDSPQECAMVNCLLVRDVVARALNGQRVPFTGQRFAFVDGEGI